jgi:hypothetical protein
MGESDMSTMTGQKDEELCTHKDGSQLAGTQPEDGKETLAHGDIEHLEMAGLCKLHPLGGLHAETGSQ